MWPGTASASLYKCQAEISLQPQIHRKLGILPKSALSIRPGTTNPGLGFCSSLPCRSDVAPDPGSFLHTLLQAYLTSPKSGKCKLIQNPSLDPGPRVLAYTNPDSGPKVQAYTTGGGRYLQRTSKDWPGALQGDLPGTPRGSRWTLRGSRDLLGCLLNIGTINNIGIIKIKPDSAQTLIKP